MTEQERHEAILEPAKLEEAICDMRFRVQDHLRVSIIIKLFLPDVNGEAKVG